MGGASPAGGGVDAVAVEAGGRASGAVGLGGGGPCCDAGTEKCHFNYWFSAEIPIIT